MYWENNPLLQTNEFVVNFIDKSCCIFCNFTKNDCNISLSNTLKKSVLKCINSGKVQNVGSTTTLGLYGVSMVPKSISRQDGLNTPQYPGL